MNVSLTVRNITQIRSGLMISVGSSVKIHKTLCEKGYIGNPDTWSCENGE